MAWREGRGRRGLLGALVDALRRLLRPAPRHTRSRPRFPKFAIDRSPYHERESALRWWTELTDRPSGEVGYMLDLSDQLASPELPLTLGLGYALHPRARPLILLDAARLGIPPEPVPLEPSKLGVERLLSGPLSDFPDALVLPAMPPEPLSGTTGDGQLIGPATSRKVGAMGLRVRRPLGEGVWQHGYLTAGHTFPDGKGTPVVRLPASRLLRFAVELAGRRTRPIGVVSLHESPVLPGGPPAFDFAVVDIDVEDNGWGAHAFSGGPPPPPRGFREPMVVTARGGVTGEVRNISLMGALMAVAHRWRDCWLLGPTGALRNGDSGAAIVNPDSGEQLGLFVGRGLVGGEAQHLYVQSVSRLAAQRLDDHGIEVEYYV